MDVTQLIGRAVISIQTSETLGNVDDVLIDPDSRRIDALGVDTGHERLLLRFDAVRSIIPNAVSIDEPAALQPAKRIMRDTWRRLDDVCGQLVLTRDGRTAGTVQALHANPASGQLTDIVVSPSASMGTAAVPRQIAPDDLLLLGPHVLIVTTSAISNNHVMH